MQKWAPFTRCGSAGKEALSIPFGSRSCADPEIPSNLRQSPRLTFRAKSLAQLSFFPLRRLCTDSLQVRSKCTRSLASPR